MWLSVGCWASTSCARITPGRTAWRICGAGSIGDRGILILPPSLLQGETSEPYRVAASKFQGSKGTMSEETTAVAAENKQWAVCPDPHHHAYDSLGAPQFFATRQKAAEWANTALAVQPEATDEAGKIICAQGWVEDYAVPRRHNADADRITRLSVGWLSPIRVISIPTCGEKVFDGDGIKKSMGTGPWPPPPRRLTLEERKAELEYEIKRDSKIHYCYLADDWQFARILSDAELGPGHVYREERRTTFAETLIEVLNDIEVALNKLHRKLRSELGSDAVSKFWQSWQVLWHIGEFCTKLKKSSYARDLYANACRRDGESVVEDRITKDLIETKVEEARRLIERKIDTYASRVAAEAGWDAHSPLPAETTTRPIDTKLEERPSIATVASVPFNRDWSDVSICFLSEERIQIKSTETTATYNYKEFDFADERKGRPNLAWTTLKLMAAGGGIDRKKFSAEEWPKTENRVKEIRAKLRSRFSIQSDPLSYDGYWYRPKFKLSLHPAFES